MALFIGTSQSQKFDNQIILKIRSWIHVQKTIESLFIIKEKKKKTVITKFHKINKKF